VSLLTLLAPAGTGGGGGGGIGTPYNASAPLANVSNGNTFTITTTVTVPQGDTLFLVCATRGTNPAVVASILGASGSWDIYTKKHATSSLGSSICRLVAGAGGIPSGTVLSVTLDAVTIRKVAMLLGVPGLLNATADVSIGASGGAGTPDTGSSASTSQAVEFAVACFSKVAATAGESGSPDTVHGTYTEFLDQVAGAATYGYGYAEWQILAATGFQEATFTPSDLTNNWVGLLLCFKGVTGSPPANTVLPVLSGTPAVGNTLSASQGSWSNSPTSYAYQWQRSATGVGSWADIASATAPSYTCNAIDANNFLRCTVTASNAAGQTAASSLATVRLPVPPTTSYPSLIVEWSPTTNPGATPVWVDITSLCRSISTQRGRQDETGSVQGATMTLILDNSSGAFDPLFSSGPNFGNVLPIRQARVRAVYNAVTYPVWRGYMQAINPQWPDLTKNDQVEVDCVDAFEALNLAAIDGLNTVLEDSGSRVATVLGFVGYTGATSLETGISQIIGDFMQGSALSHLQDVETTENGMLFVSRDGTLAFQNRQHRILHEQTSQGVIGDGGGSEVGYSSTDPAYDTAFIFNDVTATTKDGIPANSSDATSQLQYWKRSLPRSLLIAGVDEAQSCADYLRSRYAQPVLRFPTITINPAAQPTIAWPLILGLELSNRVTVKRRPPHGGTISVDCYLEGVGHTITPQGWQVTLNLSPASNQAVWVLGDSVNGVLGSTTVPGY